MEAILWQIAGYCLFFGYLYSVMSCMSEGLTDEWWEPLILGAAVPFLWLYENWMQIVGGAVVIVALVLFVTLAQCLNWICSWIWGML